jgi:WD40 repeat protein/predicted Ser/Thr protein kinase
MAVELTTDHYQSDSRLNEAIASFEQARDAGQNPNPQDWLTRYPEVASQLAEYFADQEFMKRLAGPLRPEAGPEALVSGGEPETFPEIPGYQILEVIGRGGMGVVYKAQQLNAFCRPVALKVIRPDRLEGLSPEVRGKAIERFITEAEAAAKLVHDNIVSVHEVGEVHGRPFYSMSYVVGMSLRDLIQAGPLEGRRAAAYLEKVARAVHEAHRHGILHRDLKPDNILVETKSDRPLVADFGLAKLLHGGRDVTGTGDVMGAPSYMSPEQARGSTDLTVATDVYGLGATLYALLTGQPPFQGDDPVDTLRKVAEEEPVAPRVLHPGVHRDLETICLKCLEKEPRKRYSSAEELADRLQLFIEGKPIPDRPVTRLEKFSRWCQRNPILAVTGGVASAALVAVVIISVTFGIHAHFAAKNIQNERDIADMAKEHAQDQLCRSLYEQAHTLLNSEESGRRWKILDLVREAEKLRSRDREISPKQETIALSQPVELPTKTELRSLAVSALLLRDIRVVREWPGIPVAISSNNRWALLGKDLLGPRAKLWVVNLENDGDLPSDSWELSSKEDLSDFALSSDLRWAVYRSGNRVFLRDLRLGKTEPLLDLPSEGNQPGGNMALSPEGQLLAVCSKTANSKTQIVIWDVQSKSHLNVVDDADVLGDLVFSPRGHWLAFASSKGIAVLELKKNQRPRLLPSAAIKGQTISSFTFGTDDRFLAAAYPGRLIFWDVGGQVEIGRLETESPVKNLALSPNSSLLALLGDHEDIIRFFRFARPYEEWKQKLPTRSYSNIFSWHKDGRRFFSAKRARALMLCEPAWDCPVISFRTGLKESESFEVSPNGKWFAVGSSSEFIRLIDRETGFIRELNCYKRPKKLSFSHDSRQLGVAGDGCAVVFDVPTGKEKSRRNTEGKFKPHAGVFNADGHFLVNSESKNGVEFVLDVTTGKEIWKSPEGQHILYLGGVGPFAVTAPELGFLFGISLSGIKVWDLHEKSNLGHLEPNNEELVFEGGISPDGQWGFVIAGSSFGGSGGAYVWSLPSCRKHLEIQGSCDILGGVFGPGGRLMVGYEDDTLQFWDVDRSEELFRCKWHGNSKGTIFSLSADGSLLAASDPKSPNVEVVDLNSLNRQLAEMGLDW